MLTITALYTKENINKIYLKLINYCHQLSFTQDLESILEEFLIFFPDWTDIYMMET